MGGSYVPALDKNGFQYIKLQIADADLSYTPRSFDFAAGKLNSLYNRGLGGDGTVAGAADYGDASMKFFDSSMEELVQGVEESGVDFQTRLDSNCTATEVIWTSAFDRKPIGATIQVGNAPTFDAYLWAYVDLSVLGLGKQPYLDGGFNLSLFAEKQPYRIDARTTADDPIPAGIPIGFLVRHGLLTDSTRFKLQIMMEFFK